MKKITNKLNLTEGTNEDAVVDAITGIQNSLKQKTDEVTRLTTEKDKVEKERDELKTKYEALDKSVKDSMENVKKERSKSLVKAAVDAKKIENKAETIAAWEKKATEDYDGTKLLLDSITGTVNKVAPSIVTEASKTTGAGNENLPSIENAVAQDMLRIQDKLKNQK